ncbi:MAG: MucB/RseB C-terminal domain-containing protein [Gammaproteobacteria bacterium]|nr:MucB/RseB C-terminal domain-containing protein [Gammaproteobacteria bacterium]
MAASSRLARSIVTLTLACLLMYTPVRGVRAVEDGEAAFEWLARMSHAGMMLNYDGYLLYQAGGKVEPMRVIYRGGKTGAKARMISLAGEKREVIIDSDSVICVLPDDRATVKTEGKKKRTALFSRLEGVEQDPERKQQLRTYYHLDVQDGGRVADRETTLVSVLPRDKNRYGHRLFLDKQTGLLLRSQLLTPDLMTLEDFMYASIAILPAVDDDLLRPHLEGRSYAMSTTEVAAEAPLEAKWRVKWLPPGFEMAERVRDQGMVPEMPVEHHVYSDGLSSISVFVEQLEPDAEKLDGLSTIGAVNAFGCMIDGFQITAVGEIPGMTAARVCRSVMPVR